MGSIPACSSEHPNIRGELVTQIVRVFGSADLFLRNAHDKQPDRSLHDRQRKETNPSVGTYFHAAVRHWNAQRVAGWAC